MIREPSFFILTALVKAPLHGYGILKSVEQLSRGRVKLSAGTLYAALDRLSNEGLLRDGGSEIVDGRLRKQYRITNEGLETLRESAKQFSDNAKTARNQLAQVSRS